MHNSFLQIRRSRCFVVCWIFGLVLGTVIASGADLASVSVMRQAACCPVSIPALSAAALPFLIAAYAVMIQKFEILYLLAFCRCCSYGYCAYLAVRCFGTSAWLVQPMLQFTDGAALIALCVFCLRRLSGKEGALGRDLLICLFVTAAAAVTDCLAVSPYLTMLLDS